MTEEYREDIEDIEDAEELDERDEVVDADDADDDFVDEDDDADDNDFDDEDEDVDTEVDDDDYDDAELDDVDDEDDAEQEDDDDYDDDAEETGEDAEEAGEGISDEEMDRIADTAIEALEGILKYFSLGEVTIDEYEGDEGELILDITGDDMAVLIGRHGKTLDALQFLISSITARTIGFRYPVVVDVEGYKSRQRQKLESQAFSAAKRAVSQGRSVKMRPMTPYERRIVHIALRDFDGVETASEGEGGARHVVVLPD